jgi:hypothetical protein
LVLLMSMGAHEPRKIDELLRSIWLLSDEGREAFVRKFREHFCRNCGAARTKGHPRCYCENDE